MNYILFGYGKMGKTIQQLLPNDNAIAIIDNNDDLLKSINTIVTADVAFEFSTPATAFINISTCFKYNIPVVCGTTGWTDHLSTIIHQCKTQNQSLLYSPNFSIGINILLNLNARMAELLTKFDMYNVSITETHHIHKKDAPSGTALQLQKIITNNSNYSEQDIPITSIREGEIVGIHDVIFSSDVDTIEIKHSAISRNAFAIGAITAAKWLIGKKGFFNMQDVISSM